MVEEGEEEEDDDDDWDRRVFVALIMNPQTGLGCVRFILGKRRIFYAERRRGGVLPGH